MAWSSKDTDEVLDYHINWTARLTAESDSISTSEWELDEGITKDSDAETSYTTTIWISGGTTGETYSITNRITTAVGRTYDYTGTILIEDH